MKTKIILFIVFFAFFGCKKATITISDNIDSVKIGTQIWSKYNYDHTDDLINIKASWGEITQAGYCYFNNDSSQNYGCLYNFNAVQSMHVPEGWRIPTNVDWEILAEFLGGKDVAGGKMKTTGTTLTGGNWLSPNRGATNESEFSAEPWGNIRPDGGFDNMTVQAGYWTANGDQASYSNTTGSNWTANGSQAGYSNTTGIRWTANGDQASYSNTTGSNWTANGYQAGYSNTTGSYWSLSTDGESAYVWVVNFCGTELKDFKVEKGYGWYVRLIKK